MITSIGIPITVWVLMFAVGIDLTARDFDRVAEVPKAVVVATLGQLLLLPLLAVGMVMLLEPSPVMAAGVLLIAACPGGAISNYYSYLAGANIALSVTLTAVSTVLAIVTLPVTLALEFQLALGGDSRSSIPVARVVAQLLLIVLLPVALGMWLRHARAALVERHRRLMQRASVAALALLIVLIVHDQPDAFRHDLVTNIILALLFTGFAMLAGWAIAKALALDTSIAFVFVVEFSARNLGIGAVVAVGSLARPEIIAFGTVVFLTQAVVLLGGIVTYRRLSMRRLSPG